MIFSNHSLDVFKSALKEGKKKINKGQYSYYFIISTRNNLSQDWFHSLCQIQQQRQNTVSFFQSSFQADRNQIHKQTKHLKKVRENPSDTPKAFFFLILFFSSTPLVCFICFSLLLKQHKTLNCNGTQKLQPMWTILCWIMSQLQKHKIWWFCRKILGRLTVLSVVYSHIPLLLLPKMY